MINKQLVICEPCAGEGAIIKAVNIELPNALIFSNDLVPDKSYPVLNHLDATKIASYNQMKRESNIEKIDWVITNPPFEHAFEILKASYNSVEIGVALLLRLTFLEPTKSRGEWLTEHPPTSLYILGSPRPSFTNNGSTDSTTCAWMVWLKNPSYAHTNTNGIHMLTNDSKKW